MGAGLFFAFRTAHRFFLLNACEVRIRVVAENERSQRMHTFCFQKNRKGGIPQAYEEIM